MATQGRHVQSVEKALALLDQFWMADRPMTLTELVAKTGWAKSTVHGLLSSMLDTAVVEQGPDGRYRLGYHLFELGSGVSSAWSIVEVAQPRLQALMEALGQSVYLARLSGENLILVSGAEPHYGFHISTEVGSRIPLHCTSQGKSILSAMPESRAKALLRSRGMEAITPATITDWESFRTQLELIREVGYAVERGEYRLGLQSVGAPVFDAAGNCDYAIGLVETQNAVQSGPSRRTSELVRDAAITISRDLGWKPWKRSGGMSAACP